jgi:hypothetical protein
MSSSIDSKAEIEHIQDSAPVAPELVVSKLAQLDTTPWYRKPNLRILYLILFPTCIGVEMTSGWGLILSSSALI